MTTKVGEYDCPNRYCARFHALTERRMVEGKRMRCSSCGHALRLVRVFAKMDEETKARLRALTAQRKGAA